MTELERIKKIIEGIKMKREFILRERAKVEGKFEQIEDVLVTLNSILFELERTEKAVK